MQAFTHFSRHAFERVNQRTKLKCTEIAWILDRGYFVNTGRKPGCFREHLLFYSIPDDDYFVALRDEVTGSVITILPLQYHANLAWVISEAQCDQAKKLVVSIPPESIQTREEVPPAVVVISCHFIDENGNQKSKILCKKDSAAYKFDLNRVIADEEIFCDFPFLARQKSIDPDSIFSISFRLGNRGDPVIIDLVEKNRDV